MLLFDAITQKKELETENARLRGKIGELEIALIDRDKTIEQLLKAKENGCKQGQYCASCVHGYKFYDTGHVRCICAYGQCDHFEKEAQNEPFN